MALWPFGSKEKATLTPEQRTALTSVVKKSKFEIIPLKGIQEKSEALPAGSTVTVTASPAKGIDATIELAEWLTRTGRRYDVIPHLSSKLVRDRSHLAELLTRIRAAGMKKVFVVGGDGDAIGSFKDGVDLVRAVAESGQPLEEIGVPAYPEGHSAIPNDTLMQALKDKQPHAQTMATQMAFNPNEVGEWILKVRSEGVGLPLYLGVPGVVELTKLMRIATQIGVADSARYLSKNTGLLGHIASAGSFGPDAFLRSLAPIIEDPAARVHGLHVFTFNSIDTTAAWQKRMLEELAA
jgi:methylenetetrahydrofolate reductase (NADPH)